MSDNNNELGSFLAGFVIGGLVGAATALILAPQSGAETRSQIAERGRDIRLGSEARLHQYRDLAGNRTQEYRHKAEHILADARSKVQDTSGRVQEQARIVLDSGKDRATQVKEQVSGYVSKDEAQTEDSDATSSTD